MSTLGLGGYGSSDDEDEVVAEPPVLSKPFATSSTADPVTQSQAIISQSPTNNHEPVTGPVPGPPASHLPSSPPQDPSDSSNPSQSLYTLTRQQIHSLTMPPVPNFTLPPAPPRSPGLTQQDKKIQHFLALKKQGVHYHERLLSSSALRNPEEVKQLLRYAGMEGGAEYENALPEGTGVDVRRWTRERVEEVVRGMEERRRKDREGRKGRGRDFVREGQGVGT
ncbi:hypothetical protein BDZ85DRAFT_239313 [Elsinoe ampelina]|uniref:HCNGP-like protein-domain-containing protein n=1 Tax=Elsinoe ampelina TaxID=302913 RepID=A0A6A6G9W2_9PEZI|nr:hypothetical protein BDZ85DRAFT_239313 [Elsinoe ampelina]